MPYRYVATDKQGQVKRGISDSLSKESAVQELLARGLIVITIEDAGRFGATARRGLAIFGYVSHLEKVLFTKHLSIMLKAGLTLLESLQILEEQTNAWTLRRIVRGLIRQVEAGNRFSDGLAEFPRMFSAFYVNIVRAGEASGTLSENLEHLAVQLSKDHELRQKVRSASLYPIIVFVAASAIGFFFAIYVIPQVANLFSGLQGIQLPLVTRILLRIADIARHYTFVSFFGFLAAVAAAAWIIRRPVFAPVTHMIALRMPIFGKIVRDVNLARFSLVLGTMLRSGIPITDSVHITSEVLGNRYYKKALAKAVKDMQGGTPLSESLAGSASIYPTIASRMISVGEKSGNLENVLKYLAEFYELEVETATKNLSTALEPILLLVIGLIALAMAYAILIPIYQFISAIRRI